MGGVSSRRWTTFSLPFRACRDGVWTSSSCHRLRGKAETIEVLPTIVRELFTSVYRVAAPEDNPDFRHVVDSIGTS